MPRYSEKLLKYLITTILLFNVIYITLDILDDLKEGEGLSHMVPEISAVVVSAITIVVLASRLRISRLLSSHLQTRVGELESESANWKKKNERLSNGLAQAIDEQMEKWALSSAEVEVALLLLKGLSNKEIATLRDTTEPTVKQQTSSIYRKSGLSSRAELAAFFLEDILAPREESSSAQQPV